MAEHDIKFMTLLKGKRIKLTLKASSFEGVLQRINPSKTLVLADVRSSNGCRIPGTKLFFGHEILNVEFINETRVDSSIDLVGSEEQLNVKKFQPYRKTITFDNDEDEEFVNFVVIDEVHQKFGPAVMHIQRQHTIGVGGEGVEIYKNGRLCWLQIATKNKVFLFDILLLGKKAFRNGLSMILESKRILKVIHDCRAIAGCLYAQFGVKLNNVFDTQVADVMCFYSNTGGFLPDRVSTLQEVVSLHLQVPASRLSSLQMKSQLTQEETERWYIRPCSVPLLKMMAFSVIHLQPLRLVLLDALMNDYLELVDSYLNSSHYEPDGLEHITMKSVLDLPKELRQLDEMYHKRQGKAISHYPVTEGGLLARFNPHPQSESQTSSAAEDHSNNLPDSLKPAAVEPLSAPQMGPLPDQQTICSPSVTGVSPVDVHAFSNLQAESPSSAAMSNLEKGKSVTSPLSEGVQRQCKELHKDLAGRGWLFRKEKSSLPFLPSVGRGFLLQTPSSSQVPRESTGVFDTSNSLEMAAKSASCTLTQEVSSQPEGHDDVSKDVCGSGEQINPTPQSCRFSLIRSFRSFRY